MGILRSLARKIPGTEFDTVDRDHTRIRKIMNPAFTASQLKSFLPLFRSSAHKVRPMLGILRQLSLIGLGPIVGSEVEGHSGHYFELERACKRPGLAGKMYAGCHWRGYVTELRHSSFSMPISAPVVGFDIQCGALDDSLNPVMEAYKNML